jgi:inorganic pyrophosphatase
MSKIISIACICFPDMTTKWIVDIEDFQQQLKSTIDTWKENLSKEQYDIFSTHNLGAVICEVKTIKEEA